MVPHEDSDDIFADNVERRKTAIRACPRKFLVLSAGGAYNDITLQNIYIG